MAEYEPNCSLCRKDRLAPQSYSDDICWETVCALHQQPILVLNAHRAQATPEEMEHIKEVAAKRHPGKKFRGYMASMPFHFHDHLV